MVAGGNYDDCEETSEARESYATVHDTPLFFRSPTRPSAFQAAILIPMPLLLASTPKSHVVNIFPAGCITIGDSSSALIAIGGR
jgi:hypothetical protein